MKSKASDTLFIAAKYQESTNKGFQVLKASVYISNLTFYGEGKIIGEKSAPRLLHLVDGKQMLHTIPSGADAFSFTLGIDSNIQVKGALSGALDPVHGFYWTWQSGYIHAKIEAKLQDAEGMEKEIIWHIGGYQTPYNSIRTSLLNIQTGNANLILNLDALFNSEFVSKNPTVMSPGKAACSISDLINKQFSIQQ
jgi:hypothetical protein